MTDPIVPNVPTVWPFAEEHRRLLAEGWRWSYEDLQDHKAEENPHLAYVTSGNAGMYLSTEDTPFAITIGATPIKLTGFDTQDEPQVDASTNIANSTFQVLQPGFWFIDLLGVVSLTPNSANNSPKIVCYLYNEDTQTPLMRIDAVSVPRFGEALTLRCGSRYGFTQSQVGVNMAFYTFCDNGLSVTTAVLQTLQMSIFRTSNFGTIPTSRNFTAAHAP